MPQKKNGKKRTVRPPEDAAQISRGERWWLDLMLEYVAKNISLAELARAHEVSYSTLVKRARRENWDAERAKYRQTVVRKATNRLSSAHARHYRALLAANDRLARKLEDAMKNGEEYVYYPGTKDETTGKQINTAFLRSVSDLIDRTRQVADGLLGVHTAREVEEFELERAKIDAAVSSASGGEGGGVILLPPTLDEADEEEDG